jgi:hypothetical protein
MEAYSFKPQSTVADITRQTLIDVYRSENPALMPFRLGAQVHDSVMGLYPEDPDSAWAVGEGLLEIKRIMQPMLRCGEHEFVLGVDMKVGRDWSNMKGVKWHEDPEELTRRVQEAVNG